jgi:TolA-binding protein
VALLIIGGLLVVALLAILGAVFLGISEQRADRARTNGGASLSSTATNPVLVQQSTENSEVEPSTAIRQSMPVSTERSLRSTQINQQPYALNGQFHELAVELQTLYQHAWELERRLRTLADVADRIEKTHSNQIDIEEEIHAQPSADSTL